MTRRRFRRDTAERALAEFLTRVEQANKADNYLYWVSRVTLFGSMLDPTVDRVGDVDLHVEIEWREADDDNRRRATDDRIASAREQGRTFRNILDEVAWPQTELLRFLRSTSNLLEFHGAIDHLQPAPKTRVIYERPAAPPSSS